MSVMTNYYPGGARAEEWDSVAGTYSAWDRNGTRTASRALTTAEQATLAAQDAALTAVSNQQAISVKAAAALSGNATYLALANPNTAQNSAQVQALTRQADALFRIVLGQFDSTANT